VCVVCGCVCGVCVVVGVCVCVCGVVCGVCVLILRVASCEYQVGI